MATARIKLPGSISVAPALAGVAALVSGLLCTGYFACTVYVGPDRLAVRQVFVGPSQGIQKDVIGPGLQFVLPGYERLHVFPRDMQILDLEAANEADPAEQALREDYTTAPAILIQTSDGFNVTVDVTMLYRIVDAYTVLTKIGPGNLYESNVVTRHADRILRQTLGRLTAEQFYDDNARMGAEHDARLALTDDLKEWGIEVWGVLVRHYVYDEKFQNQIEARKNEDQRKFKNEAETLRESRAAEKNRRVAEMQRDIEGRRGEGDLAVRKIQADADLYYRQEVAAGDKATALANADAAKLQQQALDQVGAGNLVGLDMADALSNIGIIVVSTTGPNAQNPLDLNQMVQKW